MHGEPMLYMDQDGDHFYACTVKELRMKAGGGRVSKMYADKKSGEVMHIGYAVGRRWFTAFRRVEIQE